MDDPRSIPEILETAAFPLPSKNVIMGFVGGSQLYGTGGPEGSDLDYYGIFIEPSANALGLDPFDHFVHGTGDGKGNDPGDIDIAFYSLRYWARLLAKGNPAIIQFLFVRPQYETDIWWGLRDLLCSGRSLMSRKQLRSYIGYGQAEYRRFLGGTGRIGNANQENPGGRDYHFKAAMQMARLLHEGIEYAERGRVTFPRPERAELQKIRSGAYNFDEMDSILQDLMKRLDGAVENSCLPGSVDRVAASRYISDVYKNFYRGEEF